MLQNVKLHSFKWKSPNKAHTSERHWQNLLKLPVSNTVCPLVLTFFQVTLKLCSHSVKCWTVVYFTRKQILLQKDATFRNCKNIASGSCSEGNNLYHCYYWSGAVCFFPIMYALHKMVPGKCDRQILLSFPVYVGLTEQIWPLLPL